MKRIIIYFLLLYAGNAIAQYHSSINLGVGKTTSEYRFFKYYIGDISFGSNYDHEIWKFLYANVEYNYGHLSNTYSYKANFNNISAGIQFNFLQKKSTHINYYFGVGYEWLQLKNEQDYNVSLQGITYINSLNISYIINDKFDIYVLYKIQQSDMKKNDDFSKVYYFHRIRFGGFNIGLRYKFSQKDKK